MVISQGLTPGSFQFFLAPGGSEVPQNATPALNYERGWNAINELIRSDSSWSGRERNVLYANNRDGTFSEVSGIAGLDFPDDSRAFALADLDHDGRLEVILKNRNAPQLRVLHNAMKDLGHSIAFRLRGTKSNRDAIGAAVTVETMTVARTFARRSICRPAPDFFRSTLRSFSSESGKQRTPVRATIRWPSGLNQVFEHLPVNQRIEIEEGSAEFAGKTFCASRLPMRQSGETPKTRSLAFGSRNLADRSLSCARFFLA